MTAKELASAIATQLTEKRGLDIRVLDLTEMRAFADVFVVATATSDRHAQALADAAVETARTHGERPLGVEGQQTGRWILVDLGAIVVHVFQGEAREFYGLDRLWGDAETLDWPRAVGETG